MESDHDVCPECGALDTCVHDNEPSSTTFSNPTEDIIDMVSVSPIQPDMEVFNTYSYGSEPDGNPRLLAYYGFVLPEDEAADVRIGFDFSDIILSWPNEKEAYHAYEILLKEWSKLEWASPTGDCGEEELVFWNDDDEEPFIINADAKVSHQLYLLCAVLGQTRNTAGLNMEELKRRIFEQTSSSDGGSISEIIADVIRRRQAKMDAGSSTQICEKLDVCRVYLSLKYRAITDFFS